MTPFRRTTAAAAALALAALAGGCVEYWGGTAPDLPSPAGWVVSEPFECPDPDILWEEVKGFAVGKKRAYRIDDDATTRSSRRIVTTWRTSLAPLRYEGKRRRRFVEILPEGDRHGWWRVRVAVVVQKNSEIDDPLNPAAAKWQSDEPDVEEADIVAYTIASRFGEHGTSREFEDR